MQICRQELSKSGHTVGRPCLTANTLSLSLSLWKFLLPLRAVPAGKLEHEGGGSLINVKAETVSKNTKLWLPADQQWHSPFCVVNQQRLFYVERGSFLSREDLVGCRQAGHIFLYCNDDHSSRRKQFTFSIVCFFLVLM